MRGLPSRPDEARHKLGRFSSTPLAGKVNQNHRREGGVKVSTYSMSTSLVHTFHCLLFCHAHTSGGDFVTLLITRLNHLSVCSFWKSQNNLLVFEKLKDEERWQVSRLIVTYQPIR